MSLLLDALKKAAEQKAEKNRQETAESGTSDETVIDAAAEDVSELEDGGLQQPQRESVDETEIDASDFDTRLERARGVPEDGTETRLEAPDLTETETRPASAQMQTGEDETIIFADEDVADFMGEPQYVGRDDRPVEDETDLSQLAPREDQTELSDVTAADYGDETDLSQLASREDETELGEAVTADYGDETDLSQLASREDETELGEAVAADYGDETDLSQLASGEDETELGEAVAADYGDETDLSQLAPGEDETEMGGVAAVSEVDETDLSQLAPREDETEMGEVAAVSEADETDLSQLAPREDETEMGGVAAVSEADETDLSQLAPREDDTDISQPFEAAQPLPAAEETDLGEPPEAADETDFHEDVESPDETDISIPPRSVADLEHAEAQRTAAADETDVSQVVETGDDTDVTDEDMSLLLVERDQTNLTSPTSATDPQIPQDQIQALQTDAGGDEELALVDTTRHRAPPGATLTSATATTSLNQDTQTARGVTTSTQTSTRTYAPDNYDRTLMRLPSEDASKLFAGMKSDSDVVMTPEYAKKVFQSKSSAQRMQQYKVYGGIAFAILLVIAIYGLFEFQAQQESIDTSLRPLKRDPMPGLIRSEGAATPQSLFTDAEIDERAKSVIESAESVVDEEPAMDETAETASDETQGDETTAMQADAGDETISATVAQQSATEESSVASENEVAMAASAAAASGTEGRQSQAESAANTEGTAVTGNASASSLEISSGERVEQKHIWLRQAYAAYRAGNDELAMELYNKVLEVDPGNRNALLARAAIHVQNNNSGDAIRDYQKLLLANPKDSLAMTSLITVANYSPRDTETQLKLMIRDEPESPYLNFALANVYGAQNRWQEAQGYYFTALQNNPGDPNYAYNLAVSLEHISKPRAAMAYYQRALDNFANGLATFNRDVVDQRLEVLGKL